MPDPRRVKVTGDLFHPHIPDGAVYVGRSGPGLAASKFANPFALRRKVWRHYPLRRYLDAALIAVTGLTAEDIYRAACDAVTPGTPAVAVAAYRLWLADQPGLIAAARAELQGRDIACWCPLPPEGEPGICHGTVLIEVSNEEENADA